MDTKNALRNHFFEIVIDNAAVAGFDGYFKEVSASWCETLGWSVKDLLKRPIIDFVHPDDRQGVFESRESLRSGGVVSKIRNRYLCRDGSYRWFEWQARADVEHQLVFAVARDITAEKDKEIELAQSRHAREMLERRLALADRMASVGTLAAGVAHEINNPLAMVMSNVSLLREELQAHAQLLPETIGSEMDQMAEEAIVGVERISAIVKTLRVFSKRSDQELEILEVQPIVEKTIQMTLGEISHRARLTQEFGVTPPVEAMEAKLSHAVLNLLVNAAHALPTRDVENNEIGVRTYTDRRGWALIEVRDNGSGMSPDVLDRVFDPFFSSRPEGRGVGVGLSITHTIVERLRGEMSVESEVGEGTTFRIALPPAGDTEVMQEHPAERY